MENICHQQPVPQTLGGAVPQPDRDAEAVIPSVFSHLCLQSRLRSLPFQRALSFCPRFCRSVSRGLVQGEALPYIIWSLELMEGTAPGAPGAGILSANTRALGTAVARQSRGAWHLSACRSTRSSCQSATSAVNKGPQAGSSSLEERGQLAGDPPRAPRHRNQSPPSLE